MEQQVITQAILDTDHDVLDPNQEASLFRLFNADGTPVDFTGVATTGAAVALTGYSAQSAAAVVATDSVNVAIAKLEASDLLSIATTATAIGTAAKTTTHVEPASGSIVPIKFTNGNSANSPTVAFNGGTARAIQLGGVAVTGAKCTVAAGGVVLCFFDGTILHQLGTVA